MVPRPCRMLSRALAASADDELVSKTFSISRAKRSKVEQARVPRSNSAVPHSRARPERWLMANATLASSEAKFPGLETEDQMAVGNERPDLRGFAAELLRDANSGFCSAERRDRRRLDTQKGRWIWLCGVKSPARCRLVGWYEPTEELSEGS